MFHRIWGHRLTPFFKMNVDAESQMNFVKKSVLLSF